MISSIKIRLINVFCYLTLACLYPNIVLANQNVSVDVLNKDDSVKLKFSGKNKIDFASSATDGSLAIKFKQPVQLDAKKIEALAKKHFRSVILEKDQRTLVISFRKHQSYKVQKVKNSKFLGVDLRKLSKPKLLAKTEKKSFKDKSINKDKNTESKKNLKLVEAKQLVKKIDLTKKNTSIIAQAKELPVEVEKMVKQQVKNKPGIPQPVIEKSALILELKNSPEEIQGPAFVAQVLSKKDDVLLPISKNPKVEIELVTKQLEALSLLNKPAELKQVVAVNNSPTINDAEKNKIISEKLKILVQPNVGGEEWNFAWLEKVAATIFVRSNCLWIVFSKHVPVDYSNVENFYKNKLEYAKQIDNKNFTVLQFKFNNLQDVKVSKNDNSWLVFVPNAHNGQKYNPANRVVEFNTPYNLGVFFPVQNTHYSVLTIMDPVVGDLLSIVPFYDYSYGITKNQLFIDFEVLKSACGFVCRNISDKASVSVVKTGIQIMVPPDNYTYKNDINKIDNNQGEDRPLPKYLFKSSVNDKKGKHSLINFAIVNKFNYLNEEKDFRKKLFSAKFGGDQYIQYGKFLFAQSLYYEAAGVFSLVNAQTNQSTNNQLKLLQAINNWLINRPGDARKNLDDIDESVVDDDHIEEIKFWKNIINVASGRSQIPVDYFYYKDKFLKDYPSDIREKVGVFAVSKNAFKAVENGDEFFVIESLLKNADRNDKKLVNSLQFLSGLIDYRAGEVERPLKLWGDLAKRTDDPENSTRASYYVILEKIKRKKISNEDAITKLESLKMQWRGDETENAILRTLGDLYFAQENYPDALRVWRIVLNYFMHANDIVLSSKMADAFLNLFTNDKRLKQMSDLNIVSLYFEFKELMPIGPISDKIVSGLIDRMINLDLLREVALLLEHQVKYRFSGEERIKAANKLAWVYLKDNKFQKAIDTIDETNDEWLTDALFRKRMYIKGLAYYQLNEYDKSLKAIRDDYSDDASDIKIRDFIAKNDWKSAAQILLYKIENSIKSGVANDSLRKDLTYLAVAYYIDSDYEGIKNIQNKYSNILENDVQASKVVNYLANDNMSLDYRFLDETLKVSVVKNFLNDYGKNTSKLNKF